MKKTTLTIASVLLATVAVALLLAYMDAKNNVKRPQTEIQKAASSSEVAIATERQFIEQMIAHHADAIGMAQLAPENAKNAQVKALAASIAVSQQKEIDEMKIWYRTWYGKDIPEMIDMAGMSEESGKMMNDLRSSSNFDLAFVTQMIPHHQNAVVMAKAILPNATHQEVKDLANSIITTQAAEISQMQKLQKTL